MEGAAGAAAARSVTTPVSSPQPSRKEWRVISDQSERSEKERSKLGQSDERLIYEVQQGRNPSDAGFCSLILDGRLDNDLLQQRLHTVVNQREELQRMETELQAQLIAKTEILEMRNSFDAQVKEHANTNAKLQEQLHERGETIYELERRLEEKERELHAIRLDNEAAWAKEDLLREQSKELQTYMRERDNSEAERAQYIKQIHEFQEHIQEKERQFIELQEQNRITQESIVYRDEQMREAQAWMSRFQEIEALQQAELRERTEQCNQLWLGCQRQAAEMERLHLHIQQLQAELAEAKERNNSISDGSQVSKSNSKDAAQIGKKSNGLLHDNGKDVPGESSGNLSNGHNESDPAFAAMNVSTQSDHLHGLSLAPSSLLGMPTYIPPGQITALHPFLMHQQGIPPSVPQSHVLHFHSVPASAMPTIQHLSLHQVAPNGSELSSNNQPPLQTDAIHSELSEANITQEIELTESVTHSNEENSLSGPQNQQTQIQEGLRLDSNEQKVEFQVKDLNTNTSLPEPVVSKGQKKAAEPTLLDEQSLLACIVRTIPPGSCGRIRLSTTLPNRLGKMLAPLHWHDYKKKYGKLDDFVASHPELFVVDDDYIQLREGAQEIIAATAAVAKVAAAAATAAPLLHPARLHSVAVTPMAVRLKKSVDDPNVKSRGPVEANASETQPERNESGSSQMKGASHGRAHGKHYGRY